jgi:hypothetical protein
MKLVCAAAVFMAVSFSSGVLATEAPALDAKKYPQDTPQNALASIVKAMESKDFAYWVTWLVVPAVNKKLMETYGSLDKYLEAQAKPERMEKVEAQSKVMKHLLEKNKTIEGESDKVKWVRFELPGEDVILQLEKQEDGRWAMNSNKRSKAGDKPEPPKPEEKK